MPNLEKITINNSSNIARTVVILHGLGADANDFAPLIPLLNLRADTQVILPSAPIRPITLNGGMEMRGWFDMASFELNVDADIEGLRESADLVMNIVRQEAIGPVLFVGFSQGGALALHLGLRERCVGILALSTWLMVGDCIEGSTPIIFMHGTNDEIVDIHYARQSAAELVAAGHSVSFYEYEMGHEVCSDQIEDLAAQLKALGF